MKELFRELLKKDKNVVKSEDIYRMFPDLNENAVQSKIKRCLRGGELKRLYKGVYAVNTFYTHKSVAEEQVAQAIDDQAYLSGLAALRFHNLIPEVVNFKTFFGIKSAKINASNIHFEIKKVDPELTSFGIEEIMVEDKCFRIADPARAIFDTFLTLRVSPKSRKQICAYLRIEDDDVDKIDWSKAFLYANHFKNNLAQEIALAMVSDNQ
jgi:predicted transcriptional regulator of viral defense system